MTKEQAKNAISREFKGAKIIGAYEYEKYFGFEIAPPNWKEGDMLADSEIFVNKKTEGIEYLSPKKLMEILDSGRKINV